MREGDRPIHIAILAGPAVTASTLNGMIDLFSGAGRDWAFITRGEMKEPLIRPYVVARSVEPFQAVNGVHIHPEFSFSDCPQPDVICIPDFFVNPGESVSGQYDAEARWLADCHGQGVMLASACSGAVLLGEAGLLANCEAAIHWGYTSTLTNHYPGVQVRMNRSIVLSGEGQRIVMAGGGSSWQDLALYLIARFVGLKEAIEVAKVYMLQWHELGQQPYASLTCQPKSADPLIGNCQEWLAEHYRTHTPIAGMMKRSGLPERSFIRRFSKATGMKPIDYLHALRLEEAKQLLETSDLKVDAIADEVGYQDVSFLNRLFRRKVGLTPIEYRRRFGSLARALTADLKSAIPGHLR
jgi:transcriptional regulator GlxA family with amidase domain